MSLTSYGNEQLGKNTHAMAGRRRVRPVRRRQSGRVQSQNVVSFQALDAREPMRCEKVIGHFAAGDIMDVHLESKDGPTPSRADLTDRFEADVAALTTQWEDELAADPGQLARVEQEVHRRCATLADHTIAAVLAGLGKRAALQRHQKKHWPYRLVRFVLPSRGR